MIVPAGRWVAGIDLAGPCNLADTALAIFAWEGDSLRLAGYWQGLGDRELRRLLAGDLGGELAAVGLDAPLSYCPGGGDRPGDAKLRKLAVAAGLPPGSIMPPTLHRMAYLTLRAVALTRGLPAAAAPLAEVHPGAAMALRGAPIDAVRGMKSSASARVELLMWLESAGLSGVAAIASPADHMVAACAAALAAWRWRQGEPTWVEPAQPPDHPYDYAC